MAWAESCYSACEACALRCGVDRHAGERGPCGLGPEGRVYKEYLHLGEERALVPSHTIFLSGCSLRCAFCSDAPAVREPLRHGAALAPETLAARIAARRRQGARNVGFVGGEPFVNALFILRTLLRCPDDTPVVWNTNLWATTEAVQTLAPVVGTWLVDFKFGNDRCAQDLSGARGYVGRMARLLRVAAAGGGAVIVRHLALPGHLTCCTRPALEWLSEHLPGCAVNLMTGYLPFELAGRDGPLGRPAATAERVAAAELLRALDLPRAMVDGVPLGAPTPGSPGSS